MNSVPEKQIPAVTPRQGEILTAAFRQFSRKGFSGTSLRDIAAEVGLTHAGVLRHFRGKAHILEELLAERDASIRDAPITIDGLRQYLLGINGADTADRAMFAILTSEAIDADHPAHTFISHLLVDSRRSVESALIESGLDPLVATSEAVRLTAAAHGLTLQALYDPDLSPAASILDREIRRISGSDPRDERSPRTETLPGQFQFDAPETGSYRSADAKRDLVVETAFDLFARGGYGPTTLREIGAAAGMAHSSLLRLFPSKETLVMEVLRLRDAKDLALVESFWDTNDPRTFFAEVVRHAESNASITEVVNLYTKLSCEAVDEAHPCHRYFKYRFQGFRAGVSRFLGQTSDAGLLIEGRDPNIEAQYLLAMWDGLQRQQLFMTDIDIAGELRAHLNSIFTEPVDV